MAESPLHKYRVVESPRAKHLRLRVSLQRGIEVVIPRDYDRGRIPALLERKRYWVRAAIERIEEQRKFVEPEPVWALPKTIKLAAIGVVCQLEVRQRKSSWAAVRKSSDDSVRLDGNIGSRSLVEASLQRWMMRLAHENLVPWLREVGRNAGLPVARVMVKRQHTRWASCSRTGTISLNARLLFLDKELVRYVFLHELCHTRYMNHSTEFWMLLKHHDSNYKEHDKKLRKAWRHVPTWFTCGRLMAS